MAGPTSSDHSAGDLPVAKHCAKRCHTICHFWKPSPSDEALARISTGEHPVSTRIGAEATRWLKANLPSGHNAQKAPAECGVLALVADIEQRDSLEQRPLLPQGRI
eukprot:12906886-Prorocentrum_lima.AAC.1